ncbi:MAG: hypothetical protein WCO89_00235 [Syntrophus sp. (in: bacteria)]
MATEHRSKKCRNVGELKEFLAHLADNVPIRGGWKEKVIFTLWQRDPGESCPLFYLGMDDE